jgi:hypothetical protein
LLYSVIAAIIGRYFYEKYTANGVSPNSAANSLPRRFSMQKSREIPLRPVLLQRCQGIDIAGHYDALRASLPAVGEIFPCCQGARAAPQHRRQPFTNRPSRGSGGWMAWWPKLPI